MARRKTATGIPAAPDAVLARAAAVAPARPPFESYYDATMPACRGPETPGNTFHHATAARINNGIFLLLQQLCEYTHQSATDNFPCDIHEIEDRVFKAAEFVRAVRDLHQVPGQREFLQSLPAGHDFYADQR